MSKPVPITGPLPPMCDYCEEPAIAEIQDNFGTRLYCCEACRDPALPKFSLTGWEQRRQSKLEVRDE